MPTLRSLSDGWVVSPLPQSSLLTPNCSLPPLHTESPSCDRSIQEVLSGPHIIPIFSQGCLLFLLLVNYLSCFHFFLFLMGIKVKCSTLRADNEPPKQGFRISVWVVCWEVLLGFRWRREPIGGLVPWALGSVLLGPLEWTTVHGGGSAQPCPTDEMTVPALLPSDVLRRPSASPCAGLGQSWPDRTCFWS